MATLLDDLDERGLLENTLVVTLAEFGRTPRSTPAWAATTSPPPGAPRSRAAASRAARSTARPTRRARPSRRRGRAAELFATIYRALGIDHQKNYKVGSRPVPLTEPGTEPIDDVLA